MNRAGWLGRPQTNRTPQDPQMSRGRDRAGRCAADRPPTRLSRMRWAVSTRAGRTAVWAMSDSALSMRTLRDVDDAAPETRLAQDLTLYLLARLGLVALVAALLVLANVPLLVALLVGLVLGMPLGMLLFRRLSARVTKGLAERGERRKAERARLRAELRGDDVLPDSEAHGSEDSP